MLFQELNAYRILLQTLFNYDWVNVPLVYVQVLSDTRSSMYSTRSSAVVEGPRDDPYQMTYCLSNFRLHAGLEKPIGLKIL